MKKDKSIKNDKSKIIEHSIVPSLFHQIFRDGEYMRRYSEQNFKPIYDENKLELRKKDIKK